MHTADTDIASVHNRIGTVAILGFCTIATQALLIRELFCTLPVNDAVYALTFACWTLFSAAGALAATRWRPGKYVRATTPLACVLTAGAAVWFVRTWSVDVVSLKHYALLPILLLGPSFVGGCGFTGAMGGEPGDSLKRGYAAEVLGGATAGILTTVHFACGGTGTAMLLALAAIAGVWAVAPESNRRPVALLSAAALGLCIGVSPLGHSLERISLKRRFAGRTIVQRRDTPRASFTHVSGWQTETVYENGVPIADAVLTVEQEAIVAALAALPDRLRHITAINSVTHGYAEAIARTTAEQIELIELTDTLAFLNDAVPNRTTWRNPHMTVHGARSLQPVCEQQSQDLVLLFSDYPSSLQASHHLSREYFKRIEPVLTEGGVLALVLPDAVGFTHPLRQAANSAIEAAMHAVFAHVRHIKTNVGAYLIIGRRQGRLDSGWDPVGTRFRASGRDVNAMADTILQQTPAVLNPHPPPASPPNTVGKPAAYWLTLAFRCTLHFRRLARLVHALGGRGVVLGLAAALFCLAGLPLGRSFQGRRLFGSSWLTTMALVYSIYAFQSLSGMAYWGVCPLIASSMMGIYLGTRYNCPHPIGRMTSVAALLVLPMLFSAFKPLAQLGTGAQLALLAAGNLATGHHQGRCVAAATESGRRGLGAGTLFAIDLLASSGGFAIGGLVLPLLFGFTASAWICALGAGLLIHAHCGKTSSHAR